jgi:hypothetical protein
MKNPGFSEVTPHCPEYGLSENPNAYAQTLAFGLFLHMTRKRPPLAHLGDGLVRGRAYFGRYEARAAPT